MILKKGREGKGREGRLGVALVGGKINAPPSNPADLQSGYLQVSRSQIKTPVVRTYTHPQPEA